MPNDSRWSDQLNLRMIRADEAWTYGLGAPVTVAVFDSGIDLTNPDLRNRLWINPGEVPGNGRDDDRNGHIDDVHGISFLGNEADIRDRLGHGTHVSGIIAAEPGNGFGVAGVAPNARIMVLRDFDGAGVGGRNSSVARAIDYAVANGAKVINLSFGCSSTPNQTCSNDVVSWAIDRARKAGVLIVAAAGNNHRSNDETPFFPASYPQDNVIAVASVDLTRTLSSFSNFGPTSVDIAAPGYQILSSGFGTAVRTDTGTSMAAPHVAGAAAWLWGMYPDASAESIRNALLAGARGQPLLYSTVASGGTLDLIGALHELDPGAEPVGVPEFAAGPPPAPVVALSRDRVVCAPGTWAPAPSGFRFEWLRAGVVVRGAAAASLRIADGDFSREIRCRVHGLGLGSDVFAESEPVAVPKPLRLAPPAVEGRLRPGGRVRCDPGKWLYGPLRIGFQWRLGTLRVGNSATYRITNHDSGRRLSCSVTVANRSGSSVASAAERRIPRR